jgi:hypothetical protein
MNSMRRFVSLPLEVSKGISYHLEPRGRCLDTRRQYIFNKKRGLTFDVINEIRYD